MSKDVAQSLWGMFEEQQKIRDGQDKNDRRDK